MSIDLREQFLHEVIPPTANVDLATRAIAEAVVDAVVDITHENGTPEGTLEAYWQTLRSGVGSLRALLAEESK